MGCRSLVVRLRLTLWRRGRHLLVVIAEERGRELVTHPARIRLPAPAIGVTVPADWGTSQKRLWKAVHRSSDAGNNLVMEIHFAVGGSPALFQRNSRTGRADLSVGDQTFLLQSPWRLGTHYQLSTKRTWNQEVGEHLIEIRSERQRWFGGFRSASFTVLVDGQVVTHREGK